ncbi:FkbM family methyltransferase [Halohasta salina]|uniref:FkbM family methyltransferase n=1 Tax=Halohasta salina TaxID=2961621 RepID=UPI0020A61AB6|nr:FkbM family methyltransferase [Halohasta salina]
MDRLLTWGRRRLRRLGYRSYYRLVAVNYAHRVLATENRTPAGRFDSYELLNRHGSDPMLAALDAHCGPEAVIYDLGANVGIYALALAVDAPGRRLVAVEPTPRTCTHLRANVDCNDLGDRIEVVACGVGDADETRPFFVSMYPELSGFDRESATRWEADLAESIALPIRRVDSIVADYPPPDAIKIDVEGASPAVLRGARETLETHRPTLFIEVHEAGLSTDTGREVRAILSAAGYAVDERDGYWRCDPP